jgi:FolB domain-containing protein
MSEPRLDKIHIRDLAIECIIGVFPFERTGKQEVIINVTLHTDFRAACSSDRIEDTLDYKYVKKQIMSMVQRSSFFLVERLAEEVARVCMESDRVVRVDVTVDKPGALRFARSVAVEITRERTASA